MQKVRVTNIVVSDPVAPFASKIRLQFFLNASGALNEELEFKIVYVGSAESPAFDQLLEDVMISVKSEGNMSFEVAAEGPDYKQIPSVNDLLGMSAIIIVGLFKNNEFFRCSFFVNNTYTEELTEEFNEKNFNIEKVKREIITEKPRVILTEIDWSDSNTALYSKMIAVGKSEDLNLLREANAALLSGMNDPFALNENSFLGKNMYLNTK